MKNQKGITLVALVVTIVVLLILAAVSIAMLRGDSGIITNAQKSKWANIEAEAIDKMMLAYNAVKTEIKVKEATETNYNATEHVSDYKEILVKELGEGYTVSDAEDYSGSDTKLTGSKIFTVTYTDKDFKTDTTDTTKPASGAKYLSIVSKVAISGSDATLLIIPERQVKSDSSSSTDTNP